MASDPASAEAKVAARPDSAAAWLGLVDAHRRAGRTDPALAACDAAIATIPRDADLHAVRGDLLRVLGRPDDARAACLSALELRPDHVSARLGLVMIAIDAGDATEARTHLSPLEAAHPDQPEVRWFSARLALLSGDAAAAAETIAALIAGGLPQAREADAQLLLSDALDRLGRPAAAFQAATRGKTLQRQLFASRAAGREPITARLARLAGWFEAADPGAWREAPPAGPSPCAGHLFLVGFPRSGTTLLEQALAGHPDVAALEEAPTLAAAHDAFLTSAEGLERLARLSPAESATWRARYWAEVAAQGVEVGGKLFLDKAPAATEDLPLVAKLFPQAKVLFAIRDPRDVVLSCLRQNFRMNAMTYAFTDLVSAAACYDACFRLAEVYRRVLPLDWHEVRHEALVADFAGGLQRICQIAGLDYRPSMADVAATAAARNVRTPSAPQVRAGLTDRGIGRWRAYADELAPVLPVLAPWAERHGYAS